MSCTTLLQSLESPISYASSVNDALHDDLPQGTHPLYYHNFDLMLLFNLGSHLIRRFLVRYVVHRNVTTFNGELLGNESPKSSLIRQ